MTVERFYLGSTERRYVKESDYDALAARLAEAERLLRWVRPFAPNDGTIRTAIDALLTPDSAPALPSWPTPLMSYEPSAYPPGPPMKITCGRCEKIITECKCELPIIVMKPTDSAELSNSRAEHTK